MDDFTNTLNQAVMVSFSRFIQDHWQERPYGLAIITGQMCNYLGFAVATEEGLARTAHKYADLGYRYRAWEWENYDLEEKLRIWLRWANPDDGWYYEDFNTPSDLQPFLDRLCDQEQCDELLESMCVDALRVLVRGAQWRELVSPFGTIIGVTAGEDPDDFLRTSTMINEYSIVKQLWGEYRQVRELDPRIQAQQPAAGDADKPRA